jgi:hypothetical protein
MELFSTLEQLFPPFPNQPPRTKNKKDEEEKKKQTKTINFVVE